MDVKLSLDGARKKPFKLDFCVAELPSSELSNRRHRFVVDAGLFAVFSIFVTAASSLLN